MTLRTSLPLFALSLTIVACSASSTDEAPGDGASAIVDHGPGEAEASSGGPSGGPSKAPPPIHLPEESDVGGVCDVTYARRWFVTLRDRACTDVAGYRGSWIAKPLDSATADSFCTMTWEGDRYSRADMDALRAFVKVQIDAMVPACSGANPALGGLTPIPHIDIVSHIGANGCDVCGKLRRDGKIIVVLPPFRTSLRQFEVKLTDGTSQAYQIEAPPGATAVELQLPPTPVGVAYRAGSVFIH